LSVPFRILSLTGGGYRGLYTAKVLEALEQEYGAPLAKHFDLLAGTSIGGVLALLLACEVPTEKIVELMKDKPRLIFKRRFLNKLFILKFLGSKITCPYTLSGLRSELSKNGLMGNKTMGDLKHKVIIPAVNFSKGGLRVFRTPHHVHSGIDAKISLVDIALATSAAPTYFPAHVINNEVFVDGGIMVNSPGLIAHHEAVHYLNQNDADISMLSISTLSSKYTISGSTSLFRGEFFWARPVIELIMSGQEMHVNDLMKHRLEKRYIHLHEQLEPNQSNDLDLDKFDKSAKQTLLAKAEETCMKAFTNPDVINFFNQSGTIKTRKEDTP